MDQAQQQILEYFSLPEHYGPVGLTWSKSGDVIEEENGQPFVFVKQLADFLEGFASVRPVMHFGMMIECWYMLGLEPPPYVPERERFRLLGVAFRKQPSSARNSGALLAHLTRDELSAIRVPEDGGKVLAQWLMHSPSVGLLHPKGIGNPESPPLPPRMLWKRVLPRLKELNDLEIRHWLRHGCPPNDAPVEEIVPLVTPPATTLLDFLTEAVKDRDRLSASVPMVRQFVSAFSLPARKQNAQQLPLGGYADITNRGRPERMLVSQFALDADEFVRRFAEQELLYFKKEDPHERTRETLWLVVDQGVRTWGSVRQMLAAAVLAFGQLAHKGGRPLHVRFSSVPKERFSPPSGDSQRFGDVLQASDLTPFPNEALSREILETPGEDIPHDVVLLTNPFTLSEPPIVQLAKQLNKNQRLFALTVDEELDVELVELRPGGTVSLKRVRMEWPKTTTPKVQSTVLPLDAWTGDIEPIPFPFRVGPIHGLEQFCFDATGQFLLAMTKQGFLYLYDLKTGTVEQLLRGCQWNTLIVPLTIVGLNRGFVVGGQHRGRYVAVYYSVIKRTAKMHVLLEDASSGLFSLKPFPELDCVVQHGSQFRVLDVGSDMVVPITSAGSAGTDRSLRVSKAIRSYADAVYPIVELSFAKFDPQETLLQGPWLRYNSQTGELIVRPRSSGGILQFTPMHDGKPLLVDSQVLRALVAGNVLAIACSHKDYRNHLNSWHFINLEDERIIRRVDFQYPWLTHSAINQSGTQFVYRTGSAAMTLVSLGDIPETKHLPGGKCHTNIMVANTPTGFHMTVGNLVLMIDWGGPIIHFQTTDARSVRPRAFNTRPGPHYDQKRFRWVHPITETMKLVADVFGQIAILQQDVPLVIFLVYRSKICFWMPDGTRYGSAEITGGLETPNALTHLTAVLKQAQGI